MNAHPRTGSGVGHDVRPFLQNLAMQQRWAANMEGVGLSEDNDSDSSSRFVISMVLIDLYRVC